MLGGGSDGAHEARVSGENRAIFLQFAGKWRAWPVVLVYRSQQPLRAGAADRPAACRHPRHRSSGGAGSRPSRPRAAAPRAPRARAAGRAPTRARRCPPSWSSIVAVSIVGVVSVFCVAVFVVFVVVVCSVDVSWVPVVAVVAVVSVDGLPPGSGLPCLAKASARAISSAAFEYWRYVGWQLLDRLAIAVERVDLAHLAVVVPVGDHQVGTRPRARRRRCRRRSGAEAGDHHDRGKCNADAQRAMRDERSRHGAVRADRNDVQGWRRSLTSLPAAIEPAIGAG